jgi:hypothetical protein
VRAGETAESIAGDTGWALDKVTRYAEPLLAERAYIAEQAQSVEIRRSGGGATLADTARTATGGADVEWDAFRRDDGRWVVTAAFADQVASWTYDHAGRNLHPLDDEARALMGARPAATRGDQLDDADIADALNLISPIPVVRTDRDEEPEPARPRLVAVPDAVPDVSDAADAADEADEADEPAPVSASHPTIAVPVEPAKPARARRTARKAPDATPAADPAPEPAPTPAARKSRSRKGRASVPTWDEILFGSGKSDDDPA